MTETKSDTKYVESSYTFPLIDSMPDCVASRWKDSDDKELGEILSIKVTGPGDQIMMLSEILWGSEV